MQTVAVEGGALEIAEHGAGRPLVLLHSLLTDSSAFDRVVPDLAREHRVILVNLPGFGRSSSVGASIERIADRVAALFSTLELPRNTDLLGNGFGGFVAGIRNPTLILVGSLDTATPPAMSQELARGIPGAAYVELPACGHAPMIQAPEAFLGAVKPFLVL